MAIAFDTYSAASGSATSPSYSFTAASGADVFVAVSTATSIAQNISSMTYGGTAMTAISTFSHNNTSTAGRTSLYRLAASGSGSAKTVSWTWGTPVRYTVSIFSYTGVSTAGTATTTAGSSSSPSIGPISCNSGDLILAVIGTGSGATASDMTATSGGTNRSLTNGGTSSYTALAVSDSTTSGTAFGTTQSASIGWSAAATVLTPSGSVTPTNQFFQMF